MRKFVVMLLLVLFLVSPGVGLQAEPFCDRALDSGRFLDWLVCTVFAMIADEGWGDPYGNWYTGG